MTDHIHRDLERLCAAERPSPVSPVPVQGSGFKVQGSKLPPVPAAVQGSGFKVQGSKFSPLAALADRIHAFQLSRFPGQSLAGKIKHLKKEADEVLADPADVIEHADCLILILGIAKLSGHTVEELLAAANAKMTINEARDWHPPDHDGVYRHKE